MAHAACHACVRTHFELVDLPETLSLFASLKTLNSILGHIQFGFPFAISTAQENNAFIMHQRQLINKDAKMIRDISRRHLWQHNIQTTKAHKT